jgi:hypothetical protein
MDSFDGSFVDAYSKTTGRKQSIPAHWFDHPVLGAGFARTPTAKARELAASSTEPSLEWGLKRLKQHARDNDVDITGLRSKPDILAAIAAPKTTTTQDPASTNETPATGVEE